MAYAAAQGDDTFTFRMSDYWPQPGCGERLVKYLGPLKPDGTIYEGLKQVHSRHLTPSGRLDFILSDYVPAAANGDLARGYRWIDNWLLRFDRRRGVVEYADQDMSERGVNGRPMFTNKVYLPGREILWGNVLTVGDVVGNRVQIDPRVMNRSGRPWDHAYNALKVEQHIPVITIGGRTFRDVVRVELNQTLCLNPGCNRSNHYKVMYFMAPGIGFVRTDTWLNGTFKGTHLLARFAIEADPKDLSCRPRRLR